MHLTGAWIAPLVAGGIGSAVLAAVAASVRREVSRLQRSLRPLRVKPADRRHRSL